MTNKFPGLDYWVSSVAFEQARAKRTDYITELRDPQTWALANVVRKQKEAEELQLLASIITTSTLLQKGGTLNA